MSRTDLAAFLPFLILGADTVAVLLVAAFYRHHKLALLLTLAGLALAFVSLWSVAPLAPRQVTPLLIIDRYALFYIGLLLAASFAVSLLAYDYLEKQREKQRVRPEEFYILLLVATFGCAVLVASSHFVSFFLGLEVLSVSLFPLMAYLRLREKSIEAGIKYLILAATSTAFLLFGMALVYADTGTMQLDGLARLATRPLGIYSLAGIALIVIGIGFKLAVVPFHMWTPDVYEGAPAPVSAFVATASKGAMVALLLRYFTAFGVTRYGSILLIFSLIAIASMIVGNLLALLQNNIKRILAYSSIAHLGYILVAFLAGGALAFEAVGFYLVAYFVTTLVAFGIVTVLSSAERDADQIEDYRGLFWRRPWLAGAFTATLLSLAGIPLTAGFVGKFYVLSAGVQATLWVPVIVLVVASTIGLFYYLRVIVALYSRPSAEEDAHPSFVLPALSLTGAAVLAVLVLLLVWFGVYPAPLITVIRAAVFKIV